MGWLDKAIDKSGMIFEVYEWCEAGDLDGFMKTHFKDKPMTEQEANNIFIQIT